eukprot:GHVU01048120.1.p4 GENE.GHVU01048120.1~~GHVU01048120.1.p4  ORF type:complete len:185 (+),score=34.77 GHVU01048120.1:1323-1877(+)
MCLRVLCGGPRVYVYVCVCVCSFVCVCVCVCAFTCGWSEVRGGSEGATEEKRQGDDGAAAVGETPAAGGQQQEQGQEEEASQESRNADGLSHRCACRNDAPSVDCCRCQLAATVRLPDGTTFSIEGREAVRAVFDDFDNKNEQRKEEDWGERSRDANPDDERRYSGYDHPTGNWGHEDASSQCE